MSCSLFALQWLHNGLRIPADEEQARVKTELLRSTCTDYAAVLHRARGDSRIADDGESWH